MFPIRNQWARINLAAQHHPRVLTIVEAIAAFIVVSFAAVYLGQYVHAMSTTSLWTDELFTIARYSSQGPLVTITNGGGNNHHFFNLVNSLTPWMDQYNPLRARLWSITAVIAMQLIVLVFFARRRRFIEGALLFQLLAVNSPLLDLTLQARGYGFACFFAVSIALLLVRYFETRHRRDVLLIALLSFLGAWTFPPFVIFAGPLLLLLFLWTKDRWIFLVGSLTALAIILVHLPVMDEITHNAVSYSSKRYNNFPGVQMVFAAIGLYLLSALDASSIAWAQFSAVMAAAILPWVAWRRRDPQGAPARIICLSFCAMFLIYLAMRTPPLRMASFGVVPLAVMATLLFQRFYRHDRFRPIRPILCIGIAAPLVLLSQTRIADFHFVPRENWKGPADFITANFPIGTRVPADFKTGYLSAYLSGEYPVVPYHRKQFVRGESISVNSRVGKRPVGIADADIARVSFPQRRWAGEQTLRFAPPVHSYIRNLTDATGRDLSGTLLDRNMHTRWRATLPQEDGNGAILLKAFLQPGKTYHSLHLICKNDQAFPETLPPTHSHITKVVIEKRETEDERISNLMLDRDLKTVWKTKGRQSRLHEKIVLRATLDPDTRYHSLHLVCPKEAWPRNLSAYQVTGDRRVPIDDADIHTLGEHLCIGLSDKTVDAVELHIAKARGIKQGIAISEIWAFKSGTVAAMPDHWHITARCMIGNRSEPVAPSDITIHGEHVGVFLGNRAIDAVEIAVKPADPHVAPDIWSISISEVWACPNRGKGDLQIRR